MKQLILNEQQFQRVSDVLGDFLKDELSLLHKKYDKTAARLMAAPGTEDSDKKYIKDVYLVRVKLIDYIRIMQSFNIASHESDRIWLNSIKEKR